MSALGGGAVAAGLRRPEGRVQEGGEHLKVAGVGAGQVDGVRGLGTTGTGDGPEGDAAHQSQQEHDGQVPPASVAEGGPEPVERRSEHLPHRRYLQSRETNGPEPRRARRGTMLSSARSPPAFPTGLGTAKGVSQRERLRASTPDDRPFRRRRRASAHDVCALPQESTARGRVLTVRASVPEVRLPSFASGSDGFFEVLGGEPDVELGGSLVVHVTLQTAGLEAGPQHPLGELDPHPREADDALSQLVGDVEELVDGHDRATRARCARPRRHRRRGP